VSGGTGALSSSAIAKAVEQAGLAPLGDRIAEQFSSYGELLVRWNSRLSLTAIRDPQEIIHRHFVECIFCAQSLPAGIGTLLDYGSGAGFPGIPIALCRPEIEVTLAESQGKKAGFLREAARVLGVEAEVFSGRVETMPASRTFDAVSMRAVDKMQMAVAHAATRVEERGWLVLLATSGTLALPSDFRASEISIPGSESGVLIRAQRDMFHVER